MPTGLRPHLNYLDFVNRANAKLKEELAGHDLRPNTLAILLNRASGAVTSLAETEVHRPRGLSWNSFKVMFILWVMGRLEQHEVSVLAEAGRATTSAIVKGLVRYGYVIQSRSSEDRRAKTLELTDNGQSVVWESYLQQNELLVHWGSALTDVEQEILRMLLLKLLSGLNSPVAER